MKRVLITITLACAMFACAEQGTSKGGNDPAPEDPASGTFAAFVIDLIENRTANDTEPVPFAEFESLPDPDADNEQVFSSLFQ